MSRLPDRALGRRDRRLQQPHQPRPHPLNARPVEQVGTIVEPQLQPLARRRRQGSADNAWHHGPTMSASRRPSASAGKTGAVDRIVLEHHQRVEQLAQTRPAPGSRPGPDADARISRDWLSCTCRQQVPSSDCSGGSLTRSGSVLMNSPTMLSMPAISGGRPATVTPNTTSSRPVSRPSRIAQAAWMKVLSVRPRCARLLRQRARSASRSAPP